jgi:uncharacterized protein (TIGR00730 family)
MELHFTRTNGEADEAIDRLIEKVGCVSQPDVVREMILTALKAGQEGMDRADLKLMNSTLKEMRFTGKVFGPYRHVRKVTVFGSARTRPEEPIYRMARLFGRRLAEAGYMVITGGGQGIMQAANEGAGPDHSFGVNIRLPFEQQPNPVLQGNPRLVTYKYFFNRKVAFVKEAHAIALFPGGFGTLDEAMETLTLVQTGKRAPVPLVLVDAPGGTYWSRWIRFFEDEMLARGYVDAADLAMFRRADSVDEAVAVIDHFYRRYHSLRYVKGRLVIRMTSEIEPRDVRRLEEQFADILTPQGGIVPSGPLPEEAGDEDVATLPRLVVDFNRRDFARLCSLIDEINRI